MKLKSVHFLPLLSPMAIKLAWFASLQRALEIHELSSVVSLPRMTLFLQLVFSRLVVDIWGTIFGSAPLLWECGLDWYQNPLNIFQEFAILLHNQALSQNYHILDATGLAILARRNQ